MKLCHALVPLLFVTALGACGKKAPPPPADVAPATTPPPESQKPPEADAGAATTAPPETQKPPESAPPTEADAGGAVATSAEADAATPPPAPDAAVLERGALVAMVSGCALCHTAFGPTGPDLANMWAGGLEIPEAFGTWRSPNISQDKKTGIGGWTDEQIIAAVREGVRPDGSRLYPIMPYQFYNAMTDADAKALVAYLRTVPAIEKAVAGNTDLELPKPEVPKAAGAAPADEPVARGQYLGTLMHCAACHTPMGPEGPDMTKLFAGGPPMEIPQFFEGTLHAANLTSDPKTGLGTWSDAEIIATLTQGKRKDGSPIMGPMAMYTMGWSKLPESDVKDIVAWLRTIPPIENVVPKSTAKPLGPPPGTPPGEAPPGDKPAEPAPDKPAEPGAAPK